MSERILRALVYIAALIAWVPLLFLVLWLVLGVPNIVGMVRLPNYSEMQYLVGVITAVCFAISLSIPAKRPALFPSPSNFKTSFNVKEVFIGIFAVSLFSVGNAVVAFPLLCYWFATERVTVETYIERVDLFPGRHSPCEVELSTEFDSFNDLCISKAQASNYQPGQAVRLSGFRFDPVALYVERVEVIQ